MSGDICANKTVMLGGTEAIRSDEKTNHFEVQNAALIQ